MATKLLLREDVEALGRSGDLVKVKPGYARNFLIPQGKAYVADKRSLRLQAKLQEERAKRAIVDKKEAEEHAVMLDALVLTSTVKVDQEGHMYGSVSANDMAQLIEEAARVKLEKRAVQLKHPIRALGEHKVVVRLKEGIKATVTLHIEAEEGSIIKDAKQLKAAKEAQAASQEQ